MVNIAHNTQVGPGVMAGAIGYDASLHGLRVHMHSIYFRNCIELNSLADRQRLILFQYEPDSGHGLVSADPTFTPSRPLIHCSEKCASQAELTRVRLFYCDHYRPLLRLPPLIDGRHPSSGRNFADSLLVFPRLSVSRPQQPPGAFSGLISRLSNFEQTRRWDDCSFQQGRDVTVRIPSLHLSSLLA
jgi:hypothetical protein